MAIQVAAVRIIEGRDVPPVGRWTVDPLHSQVEFSVRHLMIAKVRGRFRVFGGEIDIAEIPEDSMVEVEIDAASIDTGDAQRDAHLRSADFLDVEHYPKLVYHSTSVRPAADAISWEVMGNLTIRDITRPVSLLTEFAGMVTDPYGNFRTAFSAQGQIEREEFGVNWNQALEAGGFVVGKTVNIHLEIEAVLQSS
jgi:polyisoprenoid-binding protein YceI